MGPTPQWIGFSFLKKLNQLEDFKHRELVLLLEVVAGWTHPYLAAG